jgi:hypothetical protein
MSGSEKKRSDSGSDGGGGVDGADGVANNIAGLPPLIFVTVLLNLCLLLVIWLIAYPSTYPPPGTSIHTYIRLAHIACTAS